MKKIVSTVLIIMLWASFAAAQQDMTVTETEGLGTPFEGHVRFGYRWVSLDGNSKAGEYDYLHSSAAGSLNLEWDPLPHRFMLESYYLNEKDFQQFPSLRGAICLILWEENGEIKFELET